MPKLLQVLMVAVMKTTAFWDLVPCNLVEICRYFRDNPDD